MIDTKHARKNLLLSALPDADWQRILPQLEVESLALGQSIYESGRPIKKLYFPTTCVISLLHVMNDGASAEIAVAGREGVVGVSLFMGGVSTTSRAIVQSAGEAFLLRDSVVTEEFAQGGALHHLLLRYTQALLTQMAQTAVCNRHHTVDQQLCRWLLLSIDRLDTNELTMTQQLIADMLGVRREGVTEAAGKLQQIGSIEYRRGRITVRDRGIIEQLACECYEVVKKEYDRLLGPLTTATITQFPKQQTHKS